MPRAVGRAVAAAALVLAAAAACRDGGSGPPPVVDGSLDVVEVASGLASPVYLTAPPDDPRLFIVEKPGRIRIVKGGTLLETPFLDITDRVNDAGGEQGLLGLAFHPEYADNGWFYVNYTAAGGGAAGHTRVERYTVSANADVANAGSASLVLAQDQPFSNHNGGQVLFGPDGMLYIALGDGGSGGDPQDNAEDLGTPLGKLLRIDVSGAEPYEIPIDNPFTDIAGARGEIWALGLRNPWRIAFDVPAGRLYIADVGQDRFEEVNVVDAGAAGVNYGWDIMEGLSCFEPSTDCEMDGLTPPVLVYDHDEGCSVTGGFVYRGALMPAVVGHYFYADFCGGWVRSFRYAAGQAADQREWALGSLGSIQSFGVDAMGEMYILTASGFAYRMIWVDDLVE